MTLLDPRRHVAVHFGTAPPLYVPQHLTLSARREPRPKATPGWRVEANGGCAVLLRAGATRAQLLEIRDKIDAAPAAMEAPDV